MKKIFALLLCLLLMLTCCASATDHPGFSVPDDSGRAEPGSVVSEGIQLNLFGKSVTLDFDPATDFSYAKDGTIQASFYVYSEDGTYLYELYMVFPENVTSGSVFTTENAIEAGLNECNVVVLISSNSTDDLYVAAQYAGAPYPEGASYAIRFENVSDVSGGRRFSGTVSATMVGEDVNGAPISEKLVLTDAPFSFTLPSASASGQPFVGATPSPNTTPVPTPTVRPDMFRI